MESFDASAVRQQLRRLKSNQLVVTWQWNGDSCYVTGPGAGYDVNYKKATASWRDAYYVTKDAPNDKDSGAFEIFKDFGWNPITDTFTIGASASGVAAHGQTGAALDAVAYDVRVFVFSATCDEWSPYSQTVRATPSQ